MEFVNYYENHLNSEVYYSVLALMPLMEMMIPLRTNIHPLLVRWSNNFLLGMVNGLIEKFLFPILAIALAVYVKEQHLGLFNLLNVPDLVAIFFAIYFLDWVKYLLHKLMHYYPILWSFHKIHHSDPDYDFTTSFRFHPLEDILSITVTFAVIVILGVPVLAIIIIEVLSIAIGFFDHANIALPASVEKAIRLVFVTPNMHRIHHSSDEPLTNSNYSVLFPYWDYLGHTYTPVQSVNQETIPIGLEDCQGPKYLNVFWLLALPFLPRKIKQIEP